MFSNYLVLLRQKLHYSWLKSEKATHEDTRGYWRHFIVFYSFES